MNNGVQNMDMRKAMTCKICGRLLCGFADIRDDEEVPFFVMPCGDKGEKIAVCEHHVGVKKLYREMWKESFGEYPEAIEAE